MTHLFAHSDDDHDDLLSFDEVLEHHETFVGSEVTDYGDHLHNIHQFDDELWSLLIKFILSLVISCYFFAVTFLQRPPDDSYWKADYYLT